MKRAHHFRKMIAGAAGFILIGSAVPQPASAQACSLTISNVTTVCDHTDSNLCAYNFTFTVTNSGTSAYTLSPKPGSVSFPTTPIPANQTVTISSTVSVPCGTSGMPVIAQDLTSTPPCVLTANLSFPACCSAFPILAQAQDQNICKNGQTHVFVPPNTVGTVAWYQTNAPCPAGVVAPNPPWTSLSSGTNVSTPSLTQSTCFEAVVSLAGCPSIVSNPATVNVVDPGAGSITCNNGSCQSDLCTGSIVNLHYSNTTATQGCTLQWEKWNSTAGQWQAITGQTTATLAAQTLTTSACPYETFKFRMKSTCPPCSPNYTEADFNVYAPTQAGTVSSGWPVPICQGKSDFLIANGQCGDFVWESSTTGSPGSFTVISGSNNAPIWNTNPLSQTTFYDVKVTNGPCATLQSAPVKIIVEPKPTVTLTPANPPPICWPNHVQFTAAAAPAGGNYQWFLDGVATGPPSATASSYTAYVSGNYYVIYTTHCGSAKSTPVKVTISKPIAVITGACGFCPPNPVKLTAVPANGVSPYTFIWTGPNITTTSQPDVVMVSPAGNPGSYNYAVTVTDSLGCSTQAAFTLHHCPP